MNIDRTQTGDGPVITGIVGRGFRIDDGVYDGVLMTPLRADRWTPPAIAILDEAALAPLLSLDPPPEFVVIGSGSHFVRPPAGLIAAIEARGIGVEPMDSRAAARAWRVLRAEGRWIVAALYPLD